MQTIEILDIKPFMQLLLQMEFFDSYCFTAADIRADMSYHLDGHINTVYYSTEEITSYFAFTKPYVPWKLARDKVFTLIKGKRTPTTMKVVLKLNTQMQQELLTLDNSFQQEICDGLFLNILFQENRLTIVCGVSYNIFTMDKALETEFAGWFLQLLQKEGITCSFC